MFRHKKLFLLTLFFILILTSGFGCALVDKKTQEAIKPITLTYWRAWDGPDAFEEIINKYKELHPFITIEYRKLRYSEYEKELLDAMAEDKGPDIFSIHNTWVRKYQTKIAPMPAEITMAYPVTKGTFKKETVTELRTSKSLTMRELKDDFIDAVYDDVVIPIMDDKTKKETERVFGLPLSVDTLAMYYNKDLLNNAGIPEPPPYWNKDFQQAVKKLTKQDTSGEIIQSGVALGGGKNIGRYSDILSALMMQNGAVMMDEGGQVAFDKIPPKLDSRNYSPGLEALRFYSDFANPSKEVYCWNSKMENSLDMFIQGKLAIMFGYAYDLPTIKARASKLNFAIAKLPQIQGNSAQVNFANYWVETVSDKSQNLDAAWDFIQFAAKEDQARSYLNIAKKPTALRSLVGSQIDDVDIGVFAEQVLTADSWYEGKDSNAAELIIGEMIDSAVKGEDKIENIIKLGAQRVGQTVGGN